MAHTTALHTLDATGIAGWCGSLRALGGTVAEAEAIDQIAALERLKSAAAAAQARVTAALREDRVARERDAGVPARERGRALADEIALARRESPSHGSRHLGLADALVHELPFTLEHLSSGTVSEWGATLMAKETAVLDPDDRLQVDAALDARLATMTPRQIERAARSQAQTIDPSAVTRRRARARADRRVSIRPQPDTMASVSGLLPVEQGVAAWATLRRDAEAVKASGDARGLGQLMADLFVERLTGQATAGDVPVEVQLVMSPGTLLGTDDAPADLPGHGPLPAVLARELLSGDGSELEGARAWLRRVFTDEAGRVTSLDPRRRHFPQAVRRLLRVRDGVCRFAFCDAPIRHADHVIAVSAGGETTPANGQGLCARHNQTKSRPGWWAAAVGVGPVPDVITRTPTGHRYRSPVPPVCEVVAAGPGPSATSATSAASAPSALERRLASLIPPPLLDTG